MKSKKCESCDHYKMEYSPFLNAWVYRCDRECKYEPKKNKGLNVVPKETKTWQDQ